MKTGAMQVGFVAHNAHVRPACIAIKNWNDKKKDK